MDYENNLRIIARLDIKNNFLIKPIQLEGLRKVGDPNDFAQKYYNDGIDEILYLDNVASLYKRSHISSIIKKTTRNVFVPLTVGGGIKNLNHVRDILKNGADKISINSYAVNNARILREISREFGSQCLVLSIEAKKISDYKWEVYINNGREKTNLDVVEWVKQAQDFGIGELILTSIDRDGTMSGFDIPLIEAVSKECYVPLIISGGFSKIEDIVEVSKFSDLSGVAIGSALHFEKFLVNNIKQELKKLKFNVR